MNKIITIGAIGYTADTFFSALQDAGVDTFVDVRRRRAVRGAAYAFANSQLDLAPPAAVRQQQAAADTAAGVAKRKRAELSPAFIALYQAEVLAPFDPQSLRDDLPPDAAVIALMCVEREPAACHRSLLAEQLGRAWGVEVAHLIPS